MTSGPYATTSSALYEVYDSASLTAEEASGNLVISPPWIDTSGSDEIRITTANPSFSPTDNLKLRITTQPTSPSPGAARRLVAASPAQTTTDARTHANATSERDADGTAGIALDPGCEARQFRRMLQQGEVSEVNCTVESEREARCPSDAAQPGVALSLEMARNGQDFVALASEVRLALCTAAADCVPCRNFPVLKLRPPNSGEPSCIMFRTALMRAGQVRPHAPSRTPPLLL